MTELGGDGNACFYILMTIMNRKILLKQDIL